MGGVTPLVGVWIEIRVSELLSLLFVVTPLVGVWIEICTHGARIIHNVVTPLVGVWIEIRATTASTKRRLSHAPRGRVD